MTAGLRRGRGRPTTAALAVDVACFAIDENRALTVLLVQRTAEPFRGMWALPGIAVTQDEGLDDAAVRALEERTGVRNVAFIDQLYTFGDPSRDPRGRTVSVAYSALLPEQLPLVPGRETDAAEWRPFAHLPLLAFDHERIARYARWRLVQKVGYTPLAFRLLPPRFTMGDLRAVHEAVAGHSLHPSNFERQMRVRWDLVRVPGKLDRRTRRPAQLYRYTGPGDILGSPEAVEAAVRAGTAPSEEQ